VVDPSPPSNESQDLREAFAGPVGSLVLSAFGVSSDTVALRSYHWQLSLWSLGIELPLFLVHDFGWALTAPAHEVKPRLPRALLDARAELAQFRPALESYQSLLEEFVDDHVCRSCRKLRLADDAVVSVLARLLSGVAQATRQRARAEAPVPVDPGSFRSALAAQLAMFHAKSRSFELEALQALEGARALLLITLDTLDLDTLQLLGLLGGAGASQSPEIVDLLASLDSPESANVAGFALEVLPSVLEAKHRRQASNYSAHGYAGLTRRGGIDSMVLTELAWDEPELLRRLLDHELLYFAREEAEEDEQRLHWLLVDASASMRGERSTFARGMALATAKKLVLEGEEVWLSFFDARLYEKQLCSAGKLPLSHVLGFKGERGRNPARVFSELAAALELVRKKRERPLVVELFTHAALGVPRPKVEALSQLCQLRSVFVLPSRDKLELDYLDLLDAYWVVDEAALVQRHERKRRAKSILADLTGPRSAPRSEHGSLRATAPGPSLR